MKQQSSLRLQEGFLEEVRMEPEKEGLNSQVLYLTFPVSSSLRLGPRLSKKDAQSPHRTPSVPPLARKLRKSDDRKCHL